MWLNSEYLCLSMSSLRTIHYKFTVLWTINYWKIHTVVWCWCQGPAGCVEIYHCVHEATWAASFLSLAVTLMLQKIYGSVSVECVCVCVCVCVGGVGLFFNEMKCRSLACSRNKCNPWCPCIMVQECQLLTAFCWINVQIHVVCTLYPNKS